MKRLLIITSILALFGCCKKIDPRIVTNPFIILIDSTNNETSDSLFIKGIETPTTDSIKLFKHYSDNFYYISLNLRKSTKSCKFEISRNKKKDTLEVEYNSKVYKYYDCYSSKYDFEFYDIKITKTTLTLTENVYNQNNYYYGTSLGIFK